MRMSDIYFIIAMLITFATGAGASLLLSNNSDPAPCSCSDSALVASLDSLTDAIESGTKEIKLIRTDYKCWVKSENPF